MRPRMLMAASLLLDPADLEQRLAIVAWGRADDIEEDAGEGGPDVLLRDAEVVRDGPDDLPLPDIGAHSGAGREEAAPLRIDDLVTVDPDRVGRRLRPAVDHAEVPQDAEGSPDVEPHGLLVGAPEEASLGRDGRLTPEDGRVAEILRVLEIVPAGVVDDDMGQAEGQGQVAGPRVEALVAADHPVGVRNEGLVAVPAVQ